MKLEFPVKHIVSNLVFGHNKTVWAYFKIDGFSYDFLDDDEKIVPFQRQMAFLTNTGLDLHFLVVPNPTDISKILDNTIKEMKYKKYELQKQGIAFMAQVKNVLENQKELNESSEYNHYLGIQLDPEKNKYASSNIGLNAISTIKSFFQGFNSPVYSAVGLETTDILESEIIAYQNQAKVIMATLSGSFSSPVKMVGTEELVYMIEKTYSTRNNNSDIYIRKDFESGKSIEGMDSDKNVHQAIRCQKKDFFDLQNVNVEELDAKTLLLSRITDEQEIESIHVQYLTISQMEDVLYHPGSEWLYRIQSRMPFPLTISIRADHQPNEVLRKKLSNVKLEFQDQRKEALQGQQNIDLSVQVSEQGAIKMESYFQETGFPAYSCQFIFKITAGNKEQLSTRVDILRKELARYGLKIIAPYGEQLQLLSGTLPAYNRRTNDYLMEVAPNVLAGLMFGATTNIGDNRGFYIGHTSQFSKPVFVQPDLAAKAYEGLGNVVDSLSVLVAGMTGKGKSFFMNLFVYLSTLNGSSSLIIDPKGDRKEWNKGLPYIDKKFIEVWTLGSDDRDAGSLDPFRTSTNMQEAKDITMDILSYLTNIEISDDSYSLLSDAVEKASRTKDPCIGEAMNYLKDLFENRPKSMSDNRYIVLEKLIGTLETLKRNQLSLLLFGKPDQDFRVLQHKNPIQVLMIQNLNLPGLETKTLRVSHKISEAIMISITAWTKQYMYSGDRSVHKIILQDEASAIERNSMGAELMDYIVRQGRYYNTTLLKGSQNASDHGHSVANMGMKFSFGLRLTKEAEEMLNYLNLPQTRNNIETLKNLDRGEALFQDIYGRSAVIKINPIFTDLFDAFDSSTSTEEEKQRERESKTIS
ncbi:ATP-binding protein [Lentibacillus sp. N15]|uniref:ATP-binding protein n=1 Tax=Lentibacillus songyuanensis TaxID=3136161 RepID=UPI0031B9F38F